MAEDKLTEAKMAVLLFGIKFPWKPDEYLGLLPGENKWQWIFRGKGYSGRRI